MRRMKRRMRMIGSTIRWSFWIFGRWTLRGMPAVSIHCLLISFEHKAKQRRQ